MNSPEALKNVELVIFDLAGTKVEDRGEVPAAFSSALATHGSGDASRCRVRRRRDR